MLSQDQFLFYAGALLAVAALAGLIAILIYYGIASRRLRHSLDEEYGKQAR